MKVLDKNFQIITDYDLSKGKLITNKVLRKDAAPIDNITKFAYTSEDFEEVQIYVPNPVKSVAEKITELKAQLAATDYKVTKCAECLITGREMPYDAEALHLERQALRDQINELEKEVQ